MSASDTDVFAHINSHPTDFHIIPQVGIPPITVTKDCSKTSKMKITSLCLVFFGIAALVVSVAAMPTENLDEGIFEHSTSLADLEEFGLLSTNWLPEGTENLVRKTRESRKRGPKRFKSTNHKVLKQLGKKIGKRLLDSSVDIALDYVLNEIIGNIEEATD